MSVEISKATIKSVRTVSKANDDGQVEHTTAVTLEFMDLDMPTLEKLAEAAHLKVRIDLAFDWPKFGGTT